MQEIKLKITIDGKEAVASLQLTENNLKGLVSAFQQAENNAANFSSKVTDSLTKIRNVIQGVKESFDVFRQIFGASIDNYLSQEQAIAKLTTALQQSKKYTDENLKSLVDYSSRLQEITIYGDDAYQTIMAQMLAMGLSVEQTKEAALQAANLAAIMGTDLHTAARVMADFFNGNADLIKRYVKGIDESAIKSGDFNKILQELNRTIGNQAETLAQTAIESIAKFKNSPCDLLENSVKLLANAMYYEIDFVDDVLSSLVDKTNLYYYENFFYDLMNNANNVDVFKFQNTPQMTINGITILGSNRVVGIDLVKVIQMIIKYLYKDMIFVLYPGNFEYIVSRKYFTKLVYDLLFGKGPYEALDFISNSANAFVFYSEGKTFIVKKDLFSPGYYDYNLNDSIYRIIDYEISVWDKFFDGIKIKARSFTNQGDEILVEKQFVKLSTF